MDRMLVAKELVALARELSAMDFSTQKQMDEYLKDHPDADRSKHRVVKQDPSNIDTHPLNLMQKRKNEKRLDEIGKALKKDPKDLTVKDITDYNSRKSSETAAGPDLSNHVRDLVTKHTRERGGIADDKLQEILGRFRYDKREVAKDLKSLEKDGYMKLFRGKWVWNMSGEFSAASDLVALAKDVLAGERLLVGNEG